MEIPTSIESRIQRHLDSGDYSNLEELLNSALSLLEENEEEDLKEIRALVQEGIDDLEKNGGIPAEEVFKLVREQRNRYSDKPVQ